ncbi:MAG TPA: M1 family aminopeptidase/hydrolase [Thermoanaerobaculia bacterium]|jgi:aminopeptidase N
MLRSRRLLLAPFLLLSLVAARHRAVPSHFAGPDIPRDIFSHAEPDKIVTRHVTLDLTVDFDAKIVHGTARLDVVNLKGVTQLVLDTRGLDIASVTLDDGTAATFSLGPTGIPGQALTIDVKPDTKSVTIAYASRPTADGLFWNSAEQSYGRVAPYLYSQNEPDFARSWIPLQDTPTVRVTYDATIRVPAGMLALMSAENPTATNDTGVYTFRMPERIPSYLIALAVGRLEFRPLDERTGVYAEPELIEDAVWDLQYLPEMVDVAEDLVLPYPFGRYDLLLMPPTYIAGGMEHPRLNFVDPFSITAQNHPEHPLPSTLVAHELAHSWAGDRTTLGTWHDVWLNEGITSYLTLRIIEEMSGRERAEYNWYRDRRAYQSYADRATADFTKLHRPFRPTETPSVNFGSTSYTKGALFIEMLEQRLGRATFDAFLRDWFTRNAWRAVDDRAFLALLRAWAPDDVEPSLELDKWVYEPGLPSSVTAPVTSRLNDKVSAQVIRFRAGTPMAQLDTAGWTDVEIDLFLSLTNRALNGRMAEVDAHWHLSERTGPNINWLIFVIETNYTPGEAGLERVLMRGGNNNTILTLYEEMATASPAWLQKAKAFFERAQNRYEPFVRSSVAATLARFSKAAA